MRDSERRSAADWERASGEGSSVSAKRRSCRRWSGEEKARIVRESFWPRKRVEDVARRYGLSRKQLAAWRSLARWGKLAVPSSAEPEPEPAVDGSEPESAFATLEVDSATGPGSMGSVSIEARGVTVRLDGDIGALRIAEIASALRCFYVRRGDGDAGGGGHATGGFP